MVSSAQPATAPGIQDKRRRWTMAHVLAVPALPPMIWGAWTWVAWISDGIYVITEYRTPGSVSWYAAIVVQSLMVLTSVWVIYYLIKGCIQQRRIFTFDVMFSIVGAFMTATDYGLNWFQPVTTISTNLLSVNAGCGHMPFVVYPDCGRTPDPIIVNITLNAWLYLAMAIAFQAMIKRAARRWPQLNHLSPLKLFGLLIGMTVVADLIFEAAIFIPLGLWHYPGIPLGIPTLGRAFTLPIAEVIGAAFIAVLLWFRMYKDDRGLTIIERGLEHHRPWVARMITFLGMNTVFFAAAFATFIPLWFAGFFVNEWPEQNRDLVNGVCDTSGFTETRYGECPGSPGFRLPVRHSLPGESP